MLSLPAYADIAGQLAAVERMANNDPKGALATLTTMARDAKGSGHYGDLKEIEASRCWLLSYTAPAAAIELVDSNLSSSGLGNDPMLRVCRGYAYEQLNRSEDALADYEYGVTRATATNEMPALARALALRGEQRYQRGLYADAIADLKTSYDLELRLGHEGNQRYVLNALANLYADSNVKDYDSALEVYIELLKRSKETGNLCAEATANFNIASTYESKNDLTQAQVYFEHALDAETRRASSELGRAADIANDKRAYAVVLSKLGLHSQALALFDAAEITFRTGTPDTDSLAALYLSRGAAYRRAGRIPQALSDLDQALEHFKKAGNQRFLTKIHEERAAAYAQANAWHDAYRAQEQRIKAQQLLQNKRLMSEQRDYASSSSPSKRN